MAGAYRAPTHRRHRLPCTNGGTLMTKRANPRLSIRPLPAFTPYLVVTIVHLTAVFTEAGDVQAVTKPLLMPVLCLGLLLALVFGRDGRRLGRAPGRTIALLASLGIVLSWFGDVALSQPGGPGFLVGLAGFFLAHIAYIMLFVTVRRASPTRRMPWLAWIYAVWWVGFSIVLAPHAGALLLPIMLYGAALGAVAALALSCNRWIALGGALFVFSDSLLALSMFVPGFTMWHHDFFTMLAYTAAQGLIAVGVVLFVHARNAQLAAI